MRHLFDFFILGEPLASALLLTVITAVTFFVFIKSQSLSKKIQKNFQGFTIIGVLVASAIGLIVVGGMTQMLSNMYSQVQQMENKSKRIFFNEFIGATLRDGCTETLNDRGNEIINGTPLEFNILRNSDDQVVLNMGSEHERMEREYGIRGNVYFQLLCVEDPLDGCDCDADNDGTSDSKC